MAAAATPSAFTVQALPGASAQLLASLNGQYAGLIPTSDNATAPNNYFFWYFPSVNTTSDNLVVWLNGGPGCSSLYGSFSENGPMRIGSNGTLTANPYSWHLQANMLYVEQPVGTGFSADTSSKTYDEKDVGNYFNSFLTNFYEIFNETKSHNLYITGESYAGTYIPYISTTLTNATTQTSSKLKGIFLGNPFMNSNIQGSIASAVGDYDFLNEGGFFSGDAAVAQAPLATLAEKCRTATRAVAATLPYECSVLDGYQDWYARNHVGAFGAGNTCLDWYNMDNEAPCVETGVAGGGDDLTAYLNRADVQAAIHVSAQPFTWVECSKILLNDARNQPASELLDELVSSNVKIVIGQGVRDAVCHYVNVERVLSNSTWGGQKGFRDQPSAAAAWTVQGVKAGSVVRDRGISYVRILGSGHMIPTDQPLSGFGLLAELLYGDANAANAVIPAVPILPTPSTRSGVSKPVATTTKSSSGLRQVQGFACALALALLINC